MLSFIGRELTPALWAFHLYLHPDHEAMAVIVVIAGCLHQFEIGLIFEIARVARRVQMEWCQADRAFWTLSSFLYVEFFF